LPSSPIRRVLGQVPGARKCMERVKAVSAYNPYLMNRITLE
jgi:hypothetical protein